MIINALKPMQWRKKYLIQ